MRIANYVNAWDSSEIQFQKNVDEWSKTEGAYGHQHRTKPLTLAYGLNDSCGAL